MHVDTRVRRYLFRQLSSTLESSKAVLVFEHLKQTVPERFPGV